MCVTSLMRISLLQVNTSSPWIFGYIDTVVSTLRHSACVFLRRAHWSTEVLGLGGLMILHGIEQPYSRCMPYSHVYLRIFDQWHLVNWLRNKLFKKTQKKRKSKKVLQKSSKLGESTWKVKKWSEGLLMNILTTSLNPEGSSSIPYNVHGTRRKL